MPIEPAPIAAAVSIIGMFAHLSPTGASVSENATVLHVNFGANPSRVFLGASIALSTLLVMVDLLQRHPTRNAQLTARLITHGRIALMFWGGEVGLGIILPALMLWRGEPAWIVALLLIVGVALRNHILVSAPQQIPLS